MNAKQAIASLSSVVGGLVLLIALAAPAAAKPPQYGETPDRAPRPEARSEHTSPPPPSSSPSRPDPSAGASSDHRGSDGGSHGGHGSDGGSHGGHGSGSWHGSGGHDGSFHHSSPYRHYPGNFSARVYDPWWWDDSWWYGRGYYGYYPYYWPWGWGAYAVVGPGSDYQEGDMGALDLDLSPESAQVYLDGQVIGTADDFDGFPSYLWLPKGTYDLVFYKDGFQTIARQYSIYPGVVIDVEDTMARGTSVRPEDIPTKTHERRDARIREDAERGKDAEQGEAPTWRERVREQRQGEEGGQTGGVVDARGEPGRVDIAVQPTDAAVYLDGHLLGSAANLSHAPGGIIVDPGDHVIEVVRPGYASQKKSFKVAAGGQAEIDVELEKKSE